MPIEKAAAALGAESVVAAFATVFALGNLLLGALLILGGEQRLTPVSFSYVLAIAPGWAWGILFLATGSVSLLGQWWITHWTVPWRGRQLEIRPAQFSHFLAGISSLFWTYAFALGAYEAHQALLTAKAAGAAASPPQPSLTGVAAYFIIGVSHLILSAVRPRLVVGSRGS